MRHGLMAVMLWTQGTDNNMNEEWWFICAKGPTNRILYDLYPRAVMY
jgi:hypothetical protein